MNQIKIAIEQEAENDEGALYIQVLIDGQALPRILVIDEFFALQPQKSGLVPLFTCGCGDFGCNGYYVDISSTETTLFLKNQYHRFNRSLEAEFSYALDWSQVRTIAQEIVAYLEKIQERSPDAFVTIGYAGENLLTHLPNYRQSWLLSI